MEKLLSMAIYSVKVDRALQRYINPREGNFGPSEGRRCQERDGEALHVKNEKTFIRASNCKMNELSDKAFWCLPGEFLLEIDISCRNETTSWKKK